LQTADGCPSCSLSAAAADISTKFVAIDHSAGIQIVPKSKIIKVNSSHYSSVLAIAVMAAVVHQHVDQQPTQCICIHTIIIRSAVTSDELEVGNLIYI
jgi:hypothetical protein